MSKRLSANALRTGNAAAGVRRPDMFHKVKSIAPLSDFRLSVQFSEGVTKLYDLKPLFERIPAFRYLRDNPAEFGCVSVDVGGYGIIWNDELDLSCDELWENGIVKNP